MQARLACTVLSFSKPLCMDLMAAPCASQDLGQCQKELHVLSCQLWYPLTQNYYENIVSYFFRDSAPSKSPGKKDFFHKLRVKFVIVAIFDNFFRIIYRNHLSISLNQSVSLSFSLFSVNLFCHAPDPPAPILSGYIPIKGYNDNVSLN